MCSTLYMKCTTDKYELPIAVEDSPAKLARRLGLNRHSVATLCSKQICGYHRIRMEDEVMMMTENEIVREYNSARNKRREIEILADLNTTTKDEIKKILKNNGVDLRGANGGIRKPAIINEDFENAVQEMIEEGNKREEVEAADPVPGEMGYVQIIDGSDTKLPELPLKEPECDKPPLGLTPRDIAEKLFNDSRIKDIIEAMHRYYEADKAIPEAWKFELKERL